MKKLLIIATGIILAIGLNSCEKKGGIPNNDNENAIMKGAISTANIEDAEPSGDEDSREGYTPMLIPPLPGEKDNGGNRTCEAVYSWLGEGEAYLCGDKVDYDDDPEGFAASFPTGLSVTVAGIYISFTADDCIEFVDEAGVKTYWKVGAVIVKGSNAANVYYYGPEGILSDGNLFAPGEKPMVSNLTFCFVPCTPEEPKDKIAVKVFWYQGDEEADCVEVEGQWQVSAGTSYPFSEATSSWCHDFGVSPFVNTGDNPIPLRKGDDSYGEVSILDGVVTITMDPTYKIYSASIYVGDGTDIPLGDDGCPKYRQEPPFNYVTGICTDIYTADFNPPPPPEE